MYTIYVSANLQPSLVNQPASIDAISQINPGIILGNNQNVVSPVHVPAQT